MPTFTKTVEIDVDVDLTVSEILEGIDDKELRDELISRDSLYRSMADDEMLEILTEAADLARKKDKLSLAVRLDDVIKDLYL